MTVFHLHCEFTETLKGRTCESKLAESASDLGPFAFKIHSSQTADCGPGKPELLENSIRYNSEGPKPHLLQAHTSIWRLVHVLEKGRHVGRVQSTTDTYRPSKTLIWRRRLPESAALQCRVPCSPLHGEAGQRRFEEEGKETKETPCESFETG